MNAKRREKSERDPQPTDQVDLSEFDLADNGQIGRDRLMQEINVLRLEGFIFDFNPKSKRTSPRVLELADLNKRSVTIEPNPSHGLPGVIAYRVLQAIFLKMTDEGYPYSGTVSFSMRELARLIGRTSWGSETSRELYKRSDNCARQQCIARSLTRKKRSGK